MPASAPSSSTAPPRWRQFSLRTLLGLVLVCCLGLTLWNVYVEPYRRQKKVLAEIAEVHGKARTEAVPTKLGALLFGDDFFVDVVEVDLNNTKIDDAWLVRLRHLPRLQFLSIAAANVTDEGLAHLKGLARMERLFSSGTAVSDAGMMHVERMSELRILDLSDTQVSDVGMARLAGLKKLSWLQLQNTEVTEASLIHFQQLPALQTLLLVGTHIIPSARREALPRLADRVVERRLRDPAQFDFADTPLSRVVQHLKRYHRMDIVLDAHSLGKTGHSMPITSNLGNKPLGAALAEILPPHGLKAEVRFGFLMITNNDDQRPYLRRLMLKPGERLTRAFSEALYAPAIVTYDQVPLFKVLKDFTANHGTPCRIYGVNWTAETVQTKVNCDLFRGSASDVLELILDQLDLHGVIQNNTVLIRPGPLP